MSTGTFLRVEPSRDGFSVHNGERKVTVEREPTRFVATAEPGAYPLDPSATYGLIEYGRLLRAIVYALLAGTGKLEAPRRLADWHVKRHSQRIGKETHREWTRLLDGADPRAARIQRRIFAATFGCPSLAYEPQLYERPYLLADIEHYRALAALLYSAPRMASELAPKQIQGCRQYRELAALAAEQGFTVELRPDDNGDPFGSGYPDTAVTLDMLEDNWRGALSPAGEPYRSLNRTIESFPGGISRALVPNLGRVQLDHPITDRLELLALLTYAERRGTLPHLAAFMGSTREQILRAMQMVGEFTRNDLSPRRTRHVAYLARFLGDYRGEHAGTLPGLARRSIRYHRDRLEQEAAEILDELGEQPLAAPPIDPPADPEITLIASTSAIAAEGARMRHCIATYAREAIDGQAFAFHVERDGPATVLIGADGRIIDAGGPRNKRTPAMRWGARKLTAWARGFPAPARLPVGPGGEIPF